MELAGRDELIAYGPLLSVELVMLVMRMVLRVRNAGAGRFQGAAGRRRRAA